MTFTPLGLGPAAILLMALTLLIAEAYKKYSRRQKQH
jgi:hypothetical protein